MDAIARTARGVKHMVYNAELFLKWDDGKTAKIGTVSVECDKDGMKTQGLKHLRQRFGWEMVRAGFRMMLPGREWCTGAD